MLKGLRVISKWPYTWRCETKLFYLTEDMMQFPDFKFNHFSLE